MVKALLDKPNQFSPIFLSIWLLRILSSTSSRKRLAIIPSDELTSRSPNSEAMSNCLFTVVGMPSVWWWLLLLWPLLLMTGVAVGATGGSCWGKPALCKGCRKCWGGGGCLSPAAASQCRGRPMPGPIPGDNAGGGGGEGESSSSTASPMWRRTFLWALRRRKSPRLKSSMHAGWMAQKWPLPFAALPAFTKQSLRDRLWRIEFLQPGPRCLKYGKLSRMYW